MSRSGYDDNIDQHQLAMWRGQVASSIRGKRGQAFLRDLLSALDEMPEKRLIVGELEDGENVCAIGSLGRKRGFDMSKIDPEDGQAVAATFDIATQLALEVAFMNDEQHYPTPEKRWQEMRDWVASNIRKPSEVSTK